MAVSILDRPLYSVWEAALLLSVPTTTLRRWLEGGSVKGVFYPPVIREAPTGVDAVTWAEFVEAGFLRAYRRKRVPLQGLRPFIDRMRKESGVPYPLAHFKPYVLNTELVYELQEETALPPALCVVQRIGDQLVIVEQVQEWLERVEFALDADYVIRVFPLGRESPVVIDPEVSFGVPQIRGIRAELIVESVEAGGYAEAVDSWRVSETEVAAALEWSKQLARAA